MDWKILKTEKEYQKALDRAMEIFHAEPDTPEDDELGVLLLLIRDYEDRNIQMPELDVLEVIKDKMEENGIRNKDLISILGSKGHVSLVLSGKREITLKTATQLKDYFKLPAELFLNSRRYTKNQSKRIIRDTHKKVK